MLFRWSALFAVVLSAALWVRPCHGAARSAEPAEPVLAAMSVDYPVRLAPMLLPPARQKLRSTVAEWYAATASRFTTLPTSGGMGENLDALPVIGTLRRRAGRRFNTNDASIDDFAICYRLSSRLGLQFIPGDPAPVKLAITSVKNNEGVTFGMTWKVFRR